MQGVWPGLFIMTQGHSRLCSVLQILAMFSERRGCLLPSAEDESFRPLGFCDSRRGDHMNANQRADLNLKPLQQWALMNRTNHPGVSHWGALLSFLLCSSPGPLKVGR